MIGGHDRKNDGDGNFGDFDSTTTIGSDLIKEARRNAVRAMTVRCSDDAAATPGRPRPRPAHTDSILVANQHKNRGNQKFQTKDWAGAYEDYSLAIESNPDGDAAFYSNRSACLIQLDRPRQALDDAVCARMLRPTWSKACYRMAVAIIAIADDDDDDGNDDAAAEYEESNDSPRKEGEKGHGKEDLYETAAMVIWDGLLLEPKNADLKILLRRCAKSGRRRYVHQQIQQQRRLRCGMAGSSSGNNDATKDS